MLMARASRSRGWAFGAAALLLSAVGAVAVQAQPEPSEKQDPAQQPESPASAPERAKQDLPKPPAPASMPSQPDEPIETELLLKDGRKVAGIQIEQSSEKIVLRIGGIDTTFRMDVVDKVQTLPTVSQRY